ncbi:MAG: D-aminoacyl-tRNA deacylase [Candidatus Hadarchaeales archaeon]
MKVILASTKDPAAKNIAEKLIGMFKFQKLSEGVYASSNIRLEMVTGEIGALREPPAGAEEIIVASRHASASGKPSLTAHVPGFLERRELAVAKPSAVRATLVELKKAAKELALPHQVSLEATHHGPAHLDIPVIFVEIGSTEREWRNDAAGMAVAKAIMAAAKETTARNAIGVGGPHYAPLITEAVLGSDIGVGHIIPKHVETDESLLKKAIERTSGKVDVILLDWKGATKEQRELCRKISEELKIQVVRAGSILNAGSAI